MKIISSPPNAICSPEQHRWEGADDLLLAESTRRCEQLKRTVMDLHAEAGRLAAGRCPEETLRLWNAEFERVVAEARWWIGGQKMYDGIYVPMSDVHI